MTIVSLKTENSSENRAVKAEFSDGSSLLITRDYLGDDFSSALMETGRELSSGEEEAFRFAAVCYRAENAALRLIARAEQNSLALTAKLERRGFDAAVAKTVISRLLDRNLLNDSRYAERWIRSRLFSRQAKSPRWLRISLGKRGIDRHSSQKALEDALDSETEYALLLKYLEKTGLPRNKNPGSFRSQLKYEGFSPEVLDRYLENKT